MLAGVRPSLPPLRVSISLLERLADSWRRHPPGKRTSESLAGSTPVLSAMEERPVPDVFTSSKTSSPKSDTFIACVHVVNVTLKNRSLSSIPMANIDAGHVRLAIMKLEESVRSRTIPMRRWKKEGGTGNDIYYGKNKRGKTGSIRNITFGETRGLPTAKRAEIMI